MLNKLTLIGVGLIGGSLSLALKKAGYVKSVCAYDVDEVNVQFAKDTGLIDEFETDLAIAVRDADIVVIAVPVGAVADVALALKPVLGKDSVLTDVGSVKQGVVDAVTTAFGSPPTNFVPAHPIAGTEKSGARAAFATLFQDKRVMLTPTSESSDAATQLVADMWHAVGARVERIGVPEHDAIFAATSHLPHMLAYSFVNALASIDMSEEIFTYAAGGLHDFTRIASSNPIMWRDVCLHNREQLLAVIDTFTSNLSALRAGIERGDEGFLEQQFSSAKQIRDRYKPPSE